MAVGSVVVGSTAAYWSFADTAVADMVAVVDVVAAVGTVVVVVAAVDRYTYPVPADCGRSSD